jgi:hypothetical protein
MAERKYSPRFLFLIVAAALAFSTVQIQRAEAAVPKSLVCKVLAKAEVAAKADVAAEAAEVASQKAFDAALSASATKTDAGFIAAGEAAAEATKTSTAYLKAVSKAVQAAAGFQVAFNDKTFQVAFKTFNAIASKTTNTALRASLKAEADAQAAVNGLVFSSLKSNNNKALNSAFDKANKAAAAFKARFIGQAAAAFKARCSTP